MHQVFTGWLQYFLLLFFKVKCVSTSSHTLFWISLVAKKMGQQHFSSLIFPLNPEVRGRSLNQTSFGRWWRHELRVWVQMMMLSLLSLRSCRTSVDELKQHLLGDRVWDAVAHGCGQRETWVSCEGSWRRLTRPREMRTWGDVSVPTH